MGQGRRRKVIRVRLHLPYSQVVIVPPRSRVEVPLWAPGKIGVSTDACILFAGMTEIDGETTLTLGDSQEVNPGTSSVFMQMLKTPNFKIALETVEGATLLEMETSHSETEVRIWSNRVREPDEVIVGII